MQYILIVQKNINDDMMMDLSHIGFRGKLLEINCEDFSVTFTGNYIDKKVEVLNNNINVPTTIMVNWKYEDKVIIKTCTQSGELANNYGTTMMPCFYENGKYQLVIENIY